MEWKKRFKEYFTFTMKERIGIIVLLILVFVVFILPGLIAGSKKLSEMELREISRLTGVTPNDKSEFKKEDNNKGDNYHENNRNDYSSNKPAELFYFDPNTASKEEWERLGIREKSIRTILNYLSRGGHFYKPEDLRKIYGLNHILVEKLIPFVRLPEPVRERKYFVKEGARKDDRSYFKKDRLLSFKKRQSISVDINKADSAEFETLPGIGSKLAGRIVRFRERLGGFYNVRQIAEIYGLADSVFQRISPLLRVSDTPPRLININKSDVYELKNHPYIGWQVANLLVKYRLQHGDFKSVETIRDIGGISEEVAMKLLPYLSID